MADNEDETGGDIILDCDAPGDIAAEIDKQYDYDDLDR